MPSGTLEALNTVATVPWHSLPRQRVAVEFLGGLPTSFKCSQQPEPPPGPKICYHYPGEELTQATLTPPESSGVHTTDAVNQAWKMKVQKLTRIVSYFGGGLVVGGVATFLRRSVQEHCPPGSIDWSKLCDPTSWFVEEEEPKAAAAAVTAGTAVAAGGVAAASPSGEDPARGKGKGKAKMKAKAKPKARAADEESYSYEDED
eukprot:symbB.v1.2.030135.t1/scaffold3365.1/size58364/1